MFIQTQKTPNPNSLKFLPGIQISNIEPVEFLNKDQTDNYLIKDILSIDGVESVFLGSDFISINKIETKQWEDIKHIVITLINEYYESGKHSVIENNLDEEKLEKISLI